MNLEEWHGVFLISDCGDFTFVAIHQLTNL